MTLPNEQGQSPLSPSGAESPVCNILIVDDEPSNLLALEAILEPLGQRVIAAASGIEALRHALKTEFCVVLLDVQMPEMDGIETAEMLRKRPTTRDVPVIFLTAISKDASYVTRGYEAGAVDYLFKPYDPDALRTKVATFVDLGKKNASIRAQHEALRVGSERALADFKRWSERRYEDLADSMPQVVWTADAAGNITYHNQRWAELAASAPTGHHAGLRLSGGARRPRRARVPRADGSAAFAWRVRDRDDRAPGGPRVIRFRVEQRGEGVRRVGGRASSGRAFARLSLPPRSRGSTSRRSRQRDGVGGDGDGHRRTRSCRPRASECSPTRVTGSIARSAAIPYTRTQA